MNKHRSPDPRRKYQYMLDEMKVGDSWRILRIISEFVDGFDFMAMQKPMVSVFGSAQAKPDSDCYKQAVTLGTKLAEADIGVITGGGPGVMEATNKGVFNAGGNSLGVSIDLPLEEESNKYTNNRIKVQHFFVRKVLLIKYSHAFVIFPGGYGTFDELFESLNLIRTARILPFPVIMVGKSYWGGLLTWIKEATLAEGYIDQKGFDSIILTDDLDEVVRICRESIDKSDKGKYLSKLNRDTYGSDDL